jgi:hypothetical protein
MPPSPLTDGLGGGEAAQFRVRPDGIVILPPGGQHGPCLRHGGKKRLIQARFALGVTIFLTRCLTSFLSVSAQAMSRSLIRHSNRPTI